ncbi:COP9 signalosome subunit 6, partial [Atractiella rhizophila]
HPLPILNISEHLTRTRLQSNTARPQILGALLGTQTGRDVEIMNTFEISFLKNEAGKAEIDHGFLDTRSKQFKQVFPSFILLGWYSVGSEPTAEDQDVMRQLVEYNESPLFFQLSPLQFSGKDLPLTIYEPVVEIRNKEPQQFFIRVDYKIVSGEAERIAVDHTAKPAQSATSEMVQNLMTQRNAIKMLYDRVQVITQYLDALTAGKAPVDPETLRQISSLVSSLPATDSPLFREEFDTEHEDVLLTSYLAMLTKTLNATNELLDKNLFTQQSGKEGGGPGGHGGHGGGEGRPERWGRRGKGGRADMFL